MRWFYGKASVFGRIQGYFPEIHTTVKSLRMLSLVTGRSRASFYTAVIVMAFMWIMNPPMSFAIDCSNPPKGFGNAWAREYKQWCESCCGTYYQSGPRCDPGSNWGCRQQQSPTYRTPTYGQETERQRQEAAEKQRQKDGGAVRGQSLSSSRAHCPVQDPNKPAVAAKSDQKPCQELACLTYFCGGATGCPYVCCPRGTPYLNHCDCKCYSSSEFECRSYSYCQPQ